jgi:uncharacterized protein YjbJ (UPF0337 family)
MEKEVIPVSRRDKAGNTVQAAKGKAKRVAGKAAGNPYARAEAAERRPAWYRPVRS